MDELKMELDELNRSIENLERRIAEAEAEAQENINPLESELEQVRVNKRVFASKNDFESVQDCNRRESNLKFKINAQWNRSSLLRDELSRIKGERRALEDKIRLEEDRARRSDEILAQINRVLDGYEGTRDLKRAAIDANISPDHVEQWLEWGRNGFNETYSYFHAKINELDEHFRDLEKQKLINQMDDVIEAFRKTGSLKEASQIANVSYDMVMYWYEWGSRGFGEENTYFFTRIDEL